MIKKLSAVPLALFSAVLSAAETGLVNLDGSIVYVKSTRLYQDGETYKVYAPSERIYMYAGEKDGLNEKGEIVKLSCVKSKYFGDPSSPPLHVAFGELPGPNCQLQEIPVDFTHKHKSDIIPIIKVKEKTKEKPSIKNKQSANQNLSESFFCQLLATNTLAINTVFY